MRSYWSDLSISFIYFCFGWGGKGGGLWYIYLRIYYAPNGLQSNALKMFKGEFFCKPQE